MIAGGVESISCVQNEANKHMIQEAWLVEHKPEVYWPMLQTAEMVAKRYKISREAQDRYGVESQLKAAKSRAEGKFKDEIVPITTKMKVIDKKTSVRRRSRTSPPPRTKASAPTRPTRACRRSSPRSRAA